MWNCGKTSRKSLGGASAQPRKIHGRQLGRARVYRGRCAPCGAVLAALRGGANEKRYVVVPMRACRQHPVLGEAT
jgi:hypothetical protein